MLHTCGIHSGGEVDGVSPDVVLWLHGADHARRHRARVDPATQLELEACGTRKAEALQAIQTKMYAKTTQLYKNRAETICVIDTTYVG